MKPTDDLELHLTMFFANTARSRGVDDVLATVGAHNLTRALLDGPLADDAVILALADRRGITPAAPPYVDSTARPTSTHRHISLVRHPGGADL